MYCGHRISIDNGISCEKANTVPFKHPWMQSNIMLRCPSTSVAVPWCTLSYPQLHASKAKIIPFKNHGGRMSEFEVRFSQNRFESPLIHEFPISLQWIFMDFPLGIPLISAEFSSWGSQCWLHAAQCGPAQRGFGHVGRGALTIGRSSGRDDTK